MNRKQESAWLIPDDWGGEEWTCYRLQWPKSEKWERILNGLIFTLTRGREWDANSGNLADAQGAGWQVFDANMPLLPCDGTPAPPETPGGGEGVGAGIVIEGDEMGQVVTDVKLTSEGKIRVFYGHCCWEDLDISAVASAQSKVPGDIWTQFEENPTYSPCAKADAVVEYLYSMAQDFWDARDVEPWKWIGRIMGSRPELAGGQDTIFPTMINLWSVDLVYSEEDVFGADQKQSLKCIIAPQLDSEAGGMGGEGVSIILHAVNQLFDAPIALFWYGVAQTIGNGDLDEIAIAGSTNPSADCRCPDDIGEWESYDWFIDIDLTTINPYTSITDGDWSEGVGMAYERDIDSYELNATYDPEYAGGGNATIEFARVEVSGNWEPGTQVTHRLLAMTAGGSPTVLNVSDIDDGVAQWTGSEEIAASSVTISHTILWTPAPAGSSGAITRVIVAGSGINPFV